MFDGARQQLSRSIQHSNCLCTVKKNIIIINKQFPTNKAQQVEVFHLPQSMVQKTCYKCLCQSLKPTPVVPTPKSLSMSRGCRGACASELPEDIKGQAVCFLTCFCQPRELCFSHLLTAIAPLTPNPKEKKKKQNQT